MPRPCQGLIGLISSINEYLSDSGKKKKKAASHCIVVLILFQSSNNRESLPAIGNCFMLVIIAFIVVLFFNTFSGAHLNIVQPMCRAYVVMK